MIAAVPRLQVHLRFLPAHTWQVVMLAKATVSRRCESATPSGLLTALARLLGAPSRGLQVATLVQADWLFLLTDVPNLFTANPNKDPTAQPIYEVADLSKLHVSCRPAQPATGVDPMARKRAACACRAAAVMPQRASVAALAYLGVLAHPWLPTC